MASFNLVVAAFCVIGLTLIFALAYNIGGTAEETRAMKMGTITRTRMDSIRERLAICTSNNRDHETGRINKETVKKYLDDTNNLLSSENQMFKDQNHEGRMLLQECTKHLEDLREAHTGARETNATHMIDHLEDEKTRVEAAILRANATKELSREKLRKTIAAYRMELKILTKAFGKKQEESFKRAQAFRLTGSYPPTPAPPTTEAPPTPFPTVACDPSRPISIMMDAGSTGSRIHVFNFESEPGELKQLTLKDEVYEHLKPGLSAFPDDPTAAASSLIPLLDAAAKTIPPAAQHCASLALKATAGLRLLGEEKSNAILAAVMKLFAKYRFSFAEDAAVVMDGKHEGPYAWLTVNFLLGNIGKKTAAILDLGGGSTQIVFQPDDLQILEQAPAEFVYKAKVLGVSMQAYQNSYLGLGLNQAIKTLVTAAEEVTSDTFPCIPSGQLEVSKVNLTNTQSADFAACNALFRKYVVKTDAECHTAPCAFNGVYQPSLVDTFSGPIYAFSYFYDRMEPFLPDDGIVTVGKYKEVGTRICTNDGEQYAEKNKGTMCMDFAFLYTLLHDGYGLPDDATLHIKKKIKGIETAWPLGASLVNL